MYVLTTFHSNAPLKCYTTDVYTLIHSFLKERSHTKAASALKKAVTGIVAIDDGVEHEGPTLQKILEEWRELKAAADVTCVHRPYLFRPPIQTTPEMLQALIPVLVSVLRLGSFLFCSALVRV
jgi:hypothetical protein